MLEEVMVARLREDAALGELIGAAAAGLYPGEAPHSAAGRYLVYRRIDTDPAHTLASGGVHRVMLEFAAFAPSYKEALAIESALIWALHDWRDDAPALLMSMTFTGAHDGAGDFEEDARKRRSFSREIIFTALTRA